MKQCTDCGRPCNERQSYCHICRNNGKDDPFPSNEPVPRTVATNRTGVNPFSVPLRIDDSHKPQYPLVVR